MTSSGDQLRAEIAILRTRLDTLDEELDGVKARLTTLENWLHRQRTLAATLFVLVETGIAAWQHFQAVAQ